MTNLFKYTFLLFPIFVFGQYSFEKYKKVKTSSFKFEMTEQPNAVKYSKDVKSFFNDKSILEISINGNIEDSKKTYIEVSSKSKSRKYFEEIPMQGIDKLYISDFNGDGKKDFKIVCYYMGCGIASLNIRVIYFFQKANQEFTKISFDDKFGENLSERDMDQDGNFEIISMSLQDHRNHNYWLFNLYNFVNGNLICVNDKMNYPIMVQYLIKNNYTITKKLTRKEMKIYELKKPDGLLIDD